MSATKTATLAEVGRGLTTMEDDLQESIRRDVATLRRAPESDSELVVKNIGALVQRASGSSLAEIDRLMTELQKLRERVESEGERVQREIAEYAYFTQSSIESTKIIAESLAQLTANEAH